jgi:hypothetical protein
VQYKATNFYGPTHDRGIVWNDPALMIAWPVTTETAIVSDRDRSLPRLFEQFDLFEYTGAGPYRPGHSAIIARDAALPVDAALR